MTQAADSFSKPVTVSVDSIIAIDTKYISKVNISAIIVDARSILPTSIKNGIGLPTVSNSYTF